MVYHPDAGTETETYTKYIPACSEALVGVISSSNEQQKTYSWKEKTQDYKQGKKKEKEYGYVGFSGKLNGKKTGTISIDAPPNRHFFGKDLHYLSKKVYKCGKALKPELPYLVIGACFTLFEEKKTPLVATRKDENTIVFHVKSSKGWLNIKEISYQKQDYAVTNIMYFSEDGLKAVTYLQRKYPHKFSLDHSEMEEKIRLPVRLEVDLDSLHVRTKDAYTLEITHKNICSDEVKVEAELASEFKDKELKTVRGQFELKVSRYESDSPTTGKFWFYGDLETIRTKMLVCEDPFCPNGRKHGESTFLTCDGTHFSAYMDEHVLIACKNEGIRLYGFRQIRGRVAFINQKINGKYFDKKYYQTDLDALSIYYYSNGEPYPWWRWPYNVLEHYPVINPGIHEDAIPFLKAAIFSGYYPNFLFDARTAIRGLFQDGDVNLNSIKKIIWTPGTRTLTPFDGGIEEDEENGTITLSTGESDSFTFTRYKEESAYTRSIAFIDVVNDVIGYLSHEKLEIYVDNALLYEFDVPFPHVKNFFVGFYEKNGVDDVIGVWADNEKIKYAVDSYGNYLIDIDNKKTILKKSGEIEVLNKIGIL